MGLRGSPCRAPLDRGVAKGTAWRDRLGNATKPRPATRPYPINTVNAPPYNDDDDVARAIPPWDGGRLIEILADAVRRESDSLGREDHWRGVDAYDETEFHPVFAAAFRRAGFGAHREVLYPGQRGRGRRRSERERCDLVLTPAPGQRLADEEQGDREAIAEARGGLFEPLARDAARRREAGHADPGDACWIEVKTLGQFCYREGVPGPNTRYASELMAAGKDLTKLARSESILHGWLAVVLFAQDERIARHDLQQFAARLLARDAPLGDSMLVTLPIPDRIGNAAAAIGLYRARVTL